MLNAEFDSEEKAVAHRKQFGGWLFKSDCGRFIWFRFGMTPSMVMMHPSLNRLSGALY